MNIEYYMIPNDACCQFSIELIFLNLYFLLDSLIGSLLNDFDTISLVDLLPQICVWTSMEHQDLDQVSFKLVLCYNFILFYALYFSLILLMQVSFTCDLIFRCLYV